MLRTLNLSRRLSLLIAVFTISFSIFGLWAFRTLQEIKVGGQVFQRIGESKDLVSDLLPPPLYIVESYLLCLQLDQAADSSPSDDLVRRLHQLETQYRQRYEHWQERLVIVGLPSTLLDGLNVAAEAFFKEVWQTYLPSLHARNPQARKLSLEKLNTLYEQHRLAVDLTIPAAEARSAREEEWVARRVSSETTWLLGVLVVSLLAAIGLAHLIRRSIAGPLEKAVELAQRVAAGDWRSVPECKGYPDEPGQLLTALHVMAATLQQQMEALGRSEFRSRHARELLEKLIESADLIVVGVDPQGRITLFNEAAARASGYERSEVLGQEWAAIRAKLNPELRLDDIGPDQRNAVQARTYDITHLNGERRRIIWRFSSPLPQDAMHLEDGDVAEISFGIDVTEQLQAQRALRDAVAAAEAAHQSRDDFLAGMSHEVRTPMNVILGMTGLALRSELPEPARHHLKRVMTACHSLMRVINDVLDFSRIGSGGLVLENRTFALSEALDALASDTVLEADGKGLGLRFEIGSDVPPRLIGDRARLGQVLLNLVGSALSFTDHGEIRIRVDCLTQNDAQALLRFEVRDTSLGLTTEQIAGLFSALLQTAGPTPSRSRLGTGLGLAISRHLVELMRGQVWVESEPGQGTRFIFTSQLGVASDDGAGFQPPPRLQDLRILIVDDDAGSREVMAGILAPMQLQLMTVSNGEQALHELQYARTQGHPYQVVMMDWQMPDMDGLELAYRVRQSALDGPELALIMVTAHSREDLLGAAQDIRLDAVLEKPVSPRSVLEALHQALHPSRRSSAAPLADPSRPALGPPSRPLAGLRVLLVEDNELHQELAATLLSDAGAEVSMAFDGQQALDKLQQMPCDLILMDWKMPGMDGLETTRRLRAIPRFATLPIVAMTSNASPGQKMACLQAGMNDHLSKPIEPALLLSVVERWGRAAKASGLATLAQAESGSSPMGLALRNLVRPLWAELEGLLSVSDTNAASLAHPIAHLLHDHPGASSFKRVASLIEAGEFAKALHELRHLGGLLQMQGP